MQNSSLNPLMKAVKLPGRTFTFPSLGALYNDGELSNTEGEIHVQALSALDEITLKNSDLLFNGQALEQIVSTCVPDIKKPFDLYGRDIDALMLFLRIVTYGPEFQITVAHDCKQSELPRKEDEPEDAPIRYKSNDYVVDLNALLAEMKFLDPTELTTYKTVLKDTGQTVTVSPIKYRDLIALFQYALSKKDNFTVDDAKESLIRNLVMFVSDVDGTTDKNHIAEWATALTTKQTQQIMDVAEKTSDWGPASSREVKCLCCGEHFEVELPLNPITFFTE